MIYILAWALFAQAPAPKEFNRQVEVLLELAYRKPEVQKYCAANIESVIVVQIEGISLTVRCPAWLEWKRQQEKA